MDLKLKFLVDLFDCVNKSTKTLSTKEMLLTTFSVDELKTYGLETKDLDALK